MFIVDNNRQVCAGKCAQAINTSNIGMQVQRPQPNALTLPAGDRIVAVEKGHCVKIRQN